MYGCQEELLRWTPWLSIHEDMRTLMSYMVLNLRATGCELTPALRQYVEEKFSAIEKYGVKMFQVDVHIGKDTNHHNKGAVFTCSATVELVGDVMKLERTAEDLYKAIDKVKDHLRETLAQKKDRIIESHRRP